MTLKPWKVTKSSHDKSLPIFSLRTNTALSPRTNKEYDFYILESLDWVNVIPITPNNEVVMIRQYRHGTGEITLEIPGGLIDPGDDPPGAAKRELMEETGYKASEIKSLGSVHPNPAFLNNECFTFLAKDVVNSGPQDMDEKEDIEVQLIPIDDIPKLIKDGTITHSLIIAAFYRYYMEYLPEAEIR